MNLLDTLDPLLKAFWLVAIPTSLIFLLQTLLTFFGAGDTDGLDADLDGGVDAPFQLFSLRNLINFLLGFSWSGIAFSGVISSAMLLVLLALFVGLLFVYVFYLVIRQLQMLAEDNTFKLENTLFQVAEVYLTIPGQRAGIGKITISVNGAYHELSAMTEEEKIPTGSLVKIVNIENNALLLVEKI